MLDISITKSIGGMIEMESPTWDKLRGTPAVNIIMGFVIFVVVYYSVFWMLYPSDPSDRTVDIAILSAVGVATAVLVVKIALSYHLENKEIMKDRVKRREFMREFEIEKENYCPACGQVLKGVFCGDCGWGNDD